MAPVNPLVAFILSQPGMIGRLLAQHRDDGSGRCTTCSGGAQSARFVFPCSIRTRALQAREIVRGGSVDGAG